jgi:branched-chain amino acid transport system substrate-binding protein
MCKVARTLLIVGLAATVAFVCVTGCRKQNEGVIKIGALLPLTGDAAIYGQNAKQGIDLAIEEINARGGVLGRKITSVYEDSQGEPATGLAGFRKLISVDRVPVAIGGITSSVVLAVAPVANSKHVVVLSPAATSPEISKAGDFIFRNWPSDAYEGQFMARHVRQDLGISRVCVLVVNNDYGKGLREVFAKEFESLGGVIAASEIFNQNDTDFRTQISKIKTAGADGLYMVAYPDEFLLILRQVKEQGLQTKLLATCAFQDPQILAKSGGTADGVIFPYPVAPDANDPIVSSFGQDFEKKYGKKPGIVCDTGFDAVMMIVAAIQAEREASGSAIQRGLSKLRDFHGASGMMSFDRNGDVEKPMELKIVKDGQFIRFAVKGER